MRPRVPHRTVGVLADPGGAPRTGTPRFEAPFSRLQGFDFAALLFLILRSASQAVAGALFLPCPTRGARARKTSQRGSYGEFQRGDRFRPF